MGISLIVQVLFITLLSPTINFNANAYRQMQCLEHEKNLLLQLKKQLVYGPYSTKLVQWNKGDDCCKWKGVECDGGGHVIGLQLDGESISGGLDDSSSLLRLEYLEKLNLAYNDLETRQFPRGIEKLTHLTHLNISHAGFGGRFPSEISQLRSLVSLDLSSESFDMKPLSEYTSLRMLLHNLTQLRELYLDDVDLSSQGTAWLHAISSSLPLLTSLSLQDCSLSAPSDHSLSNLHYLSHLRLDGNNLSTMDPNLFANFSSLITLSAQSCSLQGYWPEVIFQIPTLQNLDLSENELLCGSIPHFPNATSLRTIDLGYTNFSGSLPDSISNLNNLSYIDLNSCQFTGSIPSTVSNLTELVYVDLSYNFFTGTISSTNFDALFNLRYLSLSGNSLTGAIPGSIFALPSLTEVSMKNNHFSGHVNEFHITNISNLVRLDVRGNRLEGPIPDSFFQLQGLQILYLSDNLFNNTFQLEKIVSLPNLTYLDLSVNNLSFDATGIRSSWDNFRDLVRQSTLSYLDISNNRLAGTIPSWIWEIGNGTLRHLNLSCNMLVDLQKPYNIPTSLYLDILDLHSNQLRGELPLPLQQANYVDLSNNYFDKYIPYTGNISAPFPLVYLSLANNSLSGSFPSFLRSCTSLTVLDLSVNNLSGSIPVGLFEIIIGLRVLNLRSNNISGRIPNKFSPYCYLSFLDLSHNNLVGQVPLSLAKCDGLQLLNVGSNHIDDVFPCMLRPSLMVMVLRSNRFHGEIKCHRSWPNLQIIDIASNNLSGYLNPSTFSGWKGMRQNSDAMLTGGNLGVITSRVGYYYGDEVTLIIKGLELKLVNIFPQFTAIDFSCNNFQGDIPNSVGELNGLHLLNLSHNSLIGTIPRSFSNLTQLEAVDLSTNQLRGEIPKELAGLTFLQIMNLSHNNLVGKIPVGSQIQTFPADSFQGNTGLCGLPLNISCTNNTSLSVPPNPMINGKTTTEIEWDYVFAALGYVVGLGIIAWMLLCCSNFRNAYFDKVEDVFDNIFHRRRHRKRRSGATRAVRIQLARQQR